MPDVTKQWTTTEKEPVIFMKKIGILTFHYSNNYGGILQAVALQKVIESMGFEVEVIDYRPSSYNPTKLLKVLGIRKNIFKNKAGDLNVINIMKKIHIARKYGSALTEKINLYRKKEMNLSRRVDENTLGSILNEYEAVVVGSDQVWTPSQRRKPEYFLNYGDAFKGRRISYAADSTTKEVDVTILDNLKKALDQFSYISVRNEHSFDFVKSVTDRDADIVVDPTVLYDFKIDQTQTTEDYILAYVLGKEINGSHRKAIEEIKRKYGNLPVYSIKIPTMKFELSGFADKVMYELGPDEWLSLFRNAKFVYTDSYHGVLFSLKFHKPFLAYYTERLRATRFIDLGERYCIDRYIVQSVDEIEQKGCLRTAPDFAGIDILLENHKNSSLELLKNALKE